MYQKLVIFITFLFILIVTPLKLAYAEPTKWEDTKTSMSALLNSGWQIVGHSSTHARASNTPVNSGFDERTFTFILTNGRNKYIYCAAENPRPPIATASGCRNLN